VLCYWHASERGTEDAGVHSFDQKNDRRRAPTALYGKVSYFDEGVDKDRGIPLFIKILNEYPSEKSLNELRSYKKLRKCKVCLKKLQQFHQFTSQATLKGNG
jgi:hypothetical protein